MKKLCFLFNLNKIALISASIIFLSANVNGQSALFISADDAKRSTPLFEAIQSGCSGVAIKVKLDKNGELTCEGKSLENTYLKKIQSEYASKESFLLLLELTGDSLKMLGALDRLLAKYEDIVSRRIRNEEIQGKLKIYVWGDIPFMQINNKENQNYFVLSLIDKERTKDGKSANALGIDFNSLYKWNGRESMPNMQYHGMQMNLKAAKKAGQKTFVFDCPETFNAWNILYNAGTDYFVVKDLEKFKRYLLEK